MAIKWPKFCCGEETRQSTKHKLTKQLPNPVPTNQKKNKRKCPKKNTQRTKKKLTNIQPDKQPYSSNKKDREEEP
jgi:hypothetical protein